MSSLCQLSATELIAKIRLKQVTAVEVLKSHLKQIEQRESQIKAWSFLDPDRALSQAKEIDQQIRQDQFSGSLAGIPVGVKDVFNTIAMPTQMGSFTWQGFQPGNDARVVFALRQEGAVFPGKTATAEFAVHTPGPTHNPHRQGFMPGTSSSGSAAAVASYMVPVSLGTQTAGSTLRPASYCGVYGFKPSFGLLPRTGILMTADTLDQVGLLARSVDDIELMFNTLRVRGKNYPLVYRNIDQAVVRSPRRFRVAAIEHPQWNKAEDYAKKALDRLVAWMGRRKKFCVSWVKLPPVFDRVHQLHERIYDKCLWYYFQKEMRRPKKVSRVFKEMIEKGEQISVDQYRQDLVAQERVRRRLARWLGDYDVAITLTTGGEAMKGLSTVDRPDACLIFTLCGVPTMSLPIFTGPTGLPFGLQVVARKYSDYLLLDFVKRLIS